MSKADLDQVGRMIKEIKTFEERHGLGRLVDRSRLPNIIKVRRGLKTYRYQLEYGDLDDRVYLSYSDPRVAYTDKHKVLMHYEESTLQGCISKAWRNLAENRVRVK